MTDRLEALDLLATMVVLAAADGRLCHVNAQFEAVAGLSRRTLVRSTLYDWVADAGPLREAVAAVLRNDTATARLDAVMRRAPVATNQWLPVHVVVLAHEASGGVLVELLEIEQQARQAEEERALAQAQAHKELIRNLAHEIKNPLGGIRGAAQLLELEAASPALAEYTQVIIHEADRLQSLVDRLLAPHRKPQQLADVNIHEVCERVRALVLAEYPQGLRLLRDYDTSLPEFRGDRAQLIQAVLNLVQNAAQALRPQIAEGTARIVLRTRVARQLTIGKARHRLALELHVEDNGPGIHEDLRDRLFYPLVSGRDGGTGLGLTLAQTFVQQHHGTILCDSQPGHTVFRTLIPLS